MLFDDGKVNCSLYLSQIYKQTITWKWTGSLKILQYQYPYLDPYMKQLNRSLRFCMCPILQTGKLVKKVGELLWFAKFTKVFSPPKFFTVRYSIFTFSVGLSIPKILMNFGLNFTADWQNFIVKDHLIILCTIPAGTMYIQLSTITWLLSSRFHKILYMSNHSGGKLMWFITKA